MLSFGLSWRRLFTIFIKFDPETKALVERLLDLFEGKQQAELDALTERLKLSKDHLKAVVDSAAQ